LQEKLDVLIGQLRKDHHNVNILYQHVWNIDIDNGLDWISDQSEIDLVAIVHHPHFAFGGIFEGSHTQRLSRAIKIPLLVFNEIESVV